MMNYFSKAFLVIWAASASVEVIMGGMIGRDHVSVINDPNMMGVERQVSDNGPMLFHNIRAPQYPVPCKIPDNNDSIQSQKRRLRSLLSMEENLEEILVHSLEENELKTKSVEHATATSEIDESTEKAKYILEYGTPETSIYHFIKACKRKMYILKWDTNGILDNHSLKSYWWVGESYDTVPPSEYGTVALLVDQDNVHDAIPFDIMPPVPILFFSIERKYENEYHKLLVDAFDKSDNDNSGQKLDIESVEAAQQNANSTWFTRNNTIIWRGTTHFIDRKQREGLVQMSNELITNNNDGSTTPWLDAQFDYDKTMSIEYMAVHYKYQIDVGGKSGTSWGGLRWKMCTGNLVFKVDSFIDSKDWWHDMIIPYIHYIPIKVDLSDLYTQYIWAENHQDEAYTIVQNGNQKCKDTFDNDFVHTYEHNVLQTIKPSSKDIIMEVDLIRSGHLKLK